MAASREPTVRKGVNLPLSVWRQVQIYQAERLLARDTIALLQVIEDGLKSPRPRSPPPSGTPKEPRR